MPYVLLFLCCFLFGCTKEKLSVHTEYLSIENLASYHVGTPDPTLNNPPVGQRLVISWSLSDCEMELADLHLNLKMRFRNREEANEKIDILKKSGIYTYSLLNEDYFDKGGILTYKVELIGGNQIIDEWRHQLWVELITLNPDCD